MSPSAAAKRAVSQRHPPRLLRCVLLLALFSWHCGSAPEHLLLERYFAASRLRDRTALARFAIVVFEPHVNGTVSTFDILAVTPAPPTVVERAGASGAERTAEYGQIAAISLADPRHPMDTSAAHVTLAVREVTVRAEVRSPDGVTRTERMVVVVARARLDGATTRQGNWVVTGFRRPDRDERGTPIDRP